MALELDIRIERDYMYVLAKGLRSREGVVEIAKRVLNYCDKYHQIKVLVDVRELKGRLGALDSYYIASEDFPGIIQSRSLKIAIIDEDLFDEVPTYFEKFAQGEGFNLRVFSSIENAALWLKG